MNLRVLTAWRRIYITFTAWSWVGGYFKGMMAVWVIFWPDALLQRVPSSAPSRRPSAVQARWYASTLHITA